MAPAWAVRPGSQHRRSPLDNRARGPAPPLWTKVPCWIFRERPDHYQENVSQCRPGSLRRATRHIENAPTHQRPNDLRVPCRKGFRFRQGSAFYPLPGGVCRNRCRSLFLYPYSVEILSQDCFGKTQIQRSSDLDVNGRSLDHRNRTTHPFHELGVICSDKALLISFIVGSFDDREPECLWSLGLTDAATIEGPLNPARFYLLDRVGGWQSHNSPPDGCRSLDHQLDLLGPDKRSDGIMNGDYAGLAFIQDLEAPVYRILPFGATG